MQARKGSLTSSPNRSQKEITNFTSKRMDQRSTPGQSYAQATANSNLYNALSDVDNDSPMDEASDGSDDTPITVNVGSTGNQKGPNATTYVLSHWQQRHLKKAANSSNTQPIKDKDHLSKTATESLAKSNQAKKLLEKSLSSTISTTVPSDDTATTESEILTSTNASSSNPEQSHSPTVISVVDTSDSSLPSQICMPKLIQNPYQKSNFKQSSPKQAPSTLPPASGSVDKSIALKKDMLRPHIHCYTLRVKFISTKSEEDEQALIQKTLQIFFDIVIQGDPKSIIPPYFELDRSDKSIPDLSSTFNVEALDSFYSLKSYFSRLSNRTAEGFIWSSIILAQSIAFSVFMEKTRHSLENQAFSLWPKASDHELATNAG
jgi:hypothetical protein